MPAPPVEAKRRSRYRGPVALADGTGVGPEDRTRGWPEPMVWSVTLEGKDDLVIHLVLPDFENVIR